MSTAAPFPAYARNPHPREVEHYTIPRNDSRRSNVFSTKGMVTSAQTLASAAGIKVLEAGGNAVDAAVAVAAALNVTEPASCGIGGDVFALYWDAKEKRVRGINGSGRSPKAMTLAKLRELGIKGDEIPISSVLSATVPGAAAAFADMVENWGSGKLSLSQVLEPAAKLADEGFPVSEMSAAAWKSCFFQLKNGANGEQMMKNGKPPAVGEIFHNKNLAKTYRELGEKGKDGFYKGRIAEAIVEGALRYSIV